MDARSLATLYSSVRRSVHRKLREEKVRKVGKRRKGNPVESTALKNGDSGRTSAQNRLADVHRSRFSGKM